MVKHINLYGILGLIASIMVGTGEFLVHYNPEGFDSEIPYGYFLGVSESRFLVGQYLMALFIPLYIFGYVHLYLALRPGGEKLAKSVLALGIFAFVIGGIWAGSRAHLGMTVQALHEANVPELQQRIIASYDMLIENLVQLLRVIVLLISLFFVWAIVNGKTLYPRWMAIFNPILVLILVFALFFFVKPIGQYLAPTAMNVAHFVMFSASLLALHKSNQPTKP